MILPHNLEAEQGLLGKLLFENALLDAICPLTQDEFYDPVHGRIYAAIVGAVRAGRLADGVTLAQALGSDPAFAELGGVRAYLMRLMDTAAPTSDQAQNYAHLIRDLATRRRIIAACRDLAVAAANYDVDIDRARMDAVDAIGLLGDIGVDNSWRSAEEIATEAVERAFTGKAKGLRTGLPALDDCTGGGRPGTVWVIGGATSMGKSIAGQQLAVNVARQGFGVAYVHLEMDYEEVGIRLASALAFDFKRINDYGDRGNPYYLSAITGKLREGQWQRLRTAATEVAPALKIYVDDRPGRTVTQIEMAIHQLFQRMRKDGVTPGLIVIDHEGLIAPEAKHPSELEAARARSTALKNMAKRLKCWTLVLSQITKEGSRIDGEDRLPSSTDLNYGSAISQAAHVVILLHRKAYYAERKPHALRTGDDERMTLSREVTLVVDKARGGRRSHIEALMDVASAVMFEPGTLP